ncbi:MAG: hypothetical protein Kilf2KO_06210 [Rhodospirillales bacterium]
MKSAFKVRSKLLASSALVGLLVLAGCDSVEDRVDDHYERGLELLAEGAPAKAGVEFRSALQLNENFVPARFELSKILEADGDRRALVGQLLKIVEIQPEHEDARVKLAEVMLMAGQLDEAMTHSEAAYKVAPNDPEVLALRATVALNLGNYKMAYDTLQKAEAAGPGDPAVGVALTSYYLRTEDAAKALQTVDSFIARNPGNLVLAVAKLQVLIAEGDQAALGAYLTELTARFPEEVGFRRSLVAWNLEAGNFDIAQQELRQLIANDRANQGYILRLVALLIAEEGFEVGRAELLDQIEAAEDKFPLQVALAGIEYDRGLTEQGKGRLQALIDAAGPRADEAKTHLARRLAKEGEAAKAAALVAEVLTADPRNVDALSLRAAIEIETGDFEQATLDLRSALNESPDNPQILGLLARAYERDGRFELASEAMASALRASAYQQDLVLRYVDMLDRNGQGRQAEIVLSEAARRDPGNAAVLTALAQARIALQMWDKAEEASEALRAIDEQSATADLILASALSGKQLHGQSIGLLRDRAEDSNSAMANLVQVYLRADQAEEARSFLQEVLAQNPRNEQALLLSAWLDLRDGKGDAAKATFRRVIAHHPESLIGYQELAKQLAREEAYSEAAEVLSAGIAEVQAADPLLLLRAGLYERAGAPKAAIADYKQLFARNPDSVVVANNLASLLSDYSGQSASDLELATQAARRLRTSKVPQFQDTYGWIAYLNGDYSEALRSLRPAAEALPENPWIRYHLGLTYAKLGQKAEGEANLKAALSYGGDSFPAAKAAREALDALQALPDPLSQ